MYLEKMIMLLAPRKCSKDCNQLQKLKFQYGKFLQCVITSYEFSNKGTLPSAGIITFLHWMSLHFVNCSYSPTKYSL